MPLPIPEDSPPQPTTVRPPQPRSGTQHDSLATPRHDEDSIPVVFELNLMHSGGVGAAYHAFARMWRDGVPGPVPARFEEYILTHLPMAQITALTQEDQGRSSRIRAIHQVWPNFPMNILTAVQGSSRAL
jgi:hypothetical protein